MTKQDIMEAVERDPEYIRKRTENLHQIDMLEGQIFDIREQIRELHRERERIYNEAYDQHEAELQEQENA